MSQGGAGSAGGAAVLRRLSALLLLALTATPWVRASEAPATVDPQLRPESKERIVGRIIAEDGAPIEHAVVVVERLVEDRWRRERRELVVEEETFLIALEGPGSYRLRFAAEGFRELRFPDVEVGVEQAYPLGLVELSRGAGARGTVYDAGTGAPLHGVLVEARPVGLELLSILLEEPPRATVTDRRGEYVLTGLDVGRYDLRWSRRDDAVAHRLVDLEDGVETLEPIHLGAGVTLYGQVRDRRGEPRPGLTVRLLDPAGEVTRAWAETATDEDGVYRFQTVAPGDYRFQVVGDRLLLVQEVEVGRGFEARQRHDLELGGVDLRGRLYLHGQPVPGGVITLTSVLERQNPGQQVHWKLGEAAVSFGTPSSTGVAEVAADGSFALADAPIGMAWLGYLHPSGARAVRRVSIPDELDAEIQVELAGAPLSGAVVVAASRGGLSEVGAAVPGPEGAVLPLSVGGDPAAGVVPIDPPRSAVGRLAVEVRRPNGETVRALALRLLDPQGVPMTPSASSDPGSFSFEDLPAGEYSLAWYDGLAGVGAVREIRIETAHRTASDLVLDTGVSVEIGCPLRWCANALVELLGVRSEHGLDLGPLLPGIAAALRFGADGRISLGRMQPGSYHLDLWVAGHQWHREVGVGISDTLIELP